MSITEGATGKMRTVRFHSYGEPADVLRLEEAEIPSPGPGHVRVRVQACGLNPADWALCRGLFPGNLPRGIGLDVSGVIDTVGEGVSNVAAGEAVLGPAEYVGYASAGLSDFAILKYWVHVPRGLDLIEAAALPMAVETAFRSLAWLGVAAGQTLLVNGGGTMVGFAAAQIALMRGARVIAIAGQTFADRLRALGAVVIPYGDGLAERVRELTSSPPDLILDTAPVNLQLDTAPAGGVLPELVKIAGGDPRRVLTCTDFVEAAKLGVRTGIGEEGTGEAGSTLRYDVLGEFANLAAERKFSVPIARTFDLDDWREALDLSMRGRAHGKLVMLLDSAAKASG